MSQEDVDAINQSKADVLKKKSSLGLLNINKRLMLFTQGKSPIVIASKEDAGVMVTLYLPLRREG